MRAINGGVSAIPNVDLEKKVEEKLPNEQNQDVNVDP